MPGLLYSRPLTPRQPTVNPCLLETPIHSQASLAKSLVVSLLLPSESWCTQCFVCGLQESVSPVLRKFCNEIPLQSQISQRCSVPLPDSQVGKSVAGPRTFATMWEILCYNCSPLCRLSAQWLCDRPHTSHFPCLLLPEPLSPKQPLLTRASTGDTEILKSRSGSGSCGVPGSCCTQGFVWAFQVSLEGVGFDFKHDFIPSTILLEKEMATHSSILARRIPWMEEPGGLQSTGSQRVRHDWASSLTHHLVGASPLPFDVGYLLSVGSNILLSMVAQQLVEILEFSQEKTSASTAPSCASYDIESICWFVSFHLLSFQLRNFHLFLFYGFHLCWVPF